MPELEITNMVMIEDRATGRVLVQDRIKCWCGIAFPGGHAENGESIYDSAVREIKEETGLDVKNLMSCGFMYWFNNRTSDRYFTYFYRTSDYSGELINETDEGKVFWTRPEDLGKLNLSPNMDKYLPMFFERKYSEAYCSWNDDEPWEFIYR